MLKKLLCTLLLAGTMPLLASAQIMPYIPGAYRLKNGTTGEGKISVDMKQHLLLVKKDNDKLSYPAAEVDYISVRGRMMKPVSPFTMRLAYGKKTVDIQDGFAEVVDTGRVEVLRYSHIVSQMRPGQNDRVIAHKALVLRVAGSAAPAVSIRDEDVMGSDRKFDELDLQTLLRVFNNDPELQTMITQKKLDARNFPDYVRAYNQRARQKS